MVPLSVAVSVTAVPVGTLMLVPLWPPPDSEVVTEVGWGAAAVTFTVSAGMPLQAVVTGGLLESPLYRACQV